MNKAELLYGKYLTSDFTDLALYFCNKAKVRLKLHLTDLIASEGLTERVDVVHSAIDWWEEREQEFKEMK